MNLNPKSPKKAAAKTPAAMPLADTELEISECRYRRLFESAKDGILILDAESGMVLDVNPFLIDLLNYSHEEFAGKAIWELGFLRDVFENQGNFFKLQEKGYIRYENLPLETADGRHVNVEFVSNVYAEGDKNVIQCNIRDITARKQVENFHEMGREILQILNAPDDHSDFIEGVLVVLKARTGFDSIGIQLQDGKDCPHFGQQEFLKNYLRTGNAVTEHNSDGRNCWDHEGNIKLEGVRSLVLSGKTDSSNPPFTKGGSFWTNDAGELLELPPHKNSQIHPRNECIHRDYASLALIPIHGKNGITGLIQLNDRHKGLLNIETVEIMEEIATHLGEALIRKQTEGQIEKISRFPAENPNPVLRVSIQGVLEYANVASNILVHTMDTHVGGMVNAEWRMRIDEVVAASHPTEIEYQTEGRTFDITAVAVVDYGYVNLYALEITKRKQAEEANNKLQAQLTQSRRMEAVGQLAGGVAHDFNNMLSIILGYVDLSLDKLSPTDPLFERLQEIKNAAKRSADLTRQLLAFARKQDIAPQSLNLNKNISDMLSMLRKLIGEDISLVWRPCAELHQVKIDPAQVDQILVNLCINARDAIDNTGTISIETGNIVIDADYCAVHAEAIPGEHVFLSISDTGCGMDRETLAHIFEPFFTTKEVGKGTGLGLATVYGIAKQNNGFVYAYSEPSQGATFKIYLPRTTQKIVAQNTTAPASTPKGRGETILLVEDNPSLNKAYQRIMDGFGYTLLSAQTPEDALRLSELHPEIHLLLTDVVMPGMNGRQLAEKIREYHPKMKVLFMSGYTADILALRGVQENQIDFIGKPFSRDELANKLRALLSSPSSSSVAPTLHPSMAAVLCEETPSCSASF
ncbi:MAG: response regulator [Pontiellaceae bacterium]|nr:response regulator [Pontiellaceae bacterium]